MTTASCPSVTAQTAYALCAYVDKAVDSLPDGWEICPAWGQTQKPNNGIFAIVAEESSSGQLAIVIQGTQNVLDLLKDFKVVPQPPFPCVVGAQISQGTAEGLAALLAIENGNGNTLQNFLLSLSPGCCLLVTGHSLGGNLSCVLAPWIAANIPAFEPPAGGVISALPPNLSVMTFAAPTAGNAAFAAFLDVQSTFSAWFNTSDAIPYAWAATGTWAVSNIDNLFPAPEPHPAPGTVRDLIASKLGEMKRAGVSYAQTRGSTFTYTPAKPALLWFEEMGIQHNQAYSAQFLGT